MTHHLADITSAVEAANARVVECVAMIDSCTRHQRGDVADTYRRLHREAVAARDALLAPLTRRERRIVLGLEN